MTAIEDLNFSHSCVDASDQYFSKVIGAIEDILMDEDFINTHRGFLETHYRNIEDTEENKFVYTDIFREYSDTIEKYIQERLHLALSDFDMKRFENELKKRQCELDGEVFEMLSTFTDFVAFKEMCLDYRAMKEGQTTDLSKGFVISKCNLPPLEEN